MTRKFKDDPLWKPIPEYTDEELLGFINRNQLIENALLGGICSEILRRMNERMIVQYHRDLLWNVKFPKKSKE